MVFTIKRLILSFLLFIPFLGISQETQLQLLDNINNEPVAFANVIITPINSNNAVGYVSDEKGQISFEIEKKSVLKLTYVGYQDITDTILPGENKTLYLKSISYNVDEFVVTGQYVASRQDKSIYKVKVLNSREIEQRAAVNIKEMLSTELNIRTSRDNVLGSSIKMQGLGGEHIKFLIDGVPVIGRENGNIDLDQINLQNVDHVEVINGPMSVVYGSNALAGVINIITKSPDRLLYSSYVDAYYESVGVYNFSAGVSRSLKRSSFSLNAGRNFFDGFSTDKVEGQRFQDWKPKKQWNFSADYKYKWKSSFLKLGATYFSEELRDLDSLRAPYFETARDKYFYTKRFVFRSEFHHEFSEKSRVNAIASYSNYSKIRNTYLNDLTTLEKKLAFGQQDTVLFNNMMLRSDYSFGDENSLIRFQTGIDLNKEAGTGEKIENQRQEIGDYAAFISMNYSPLSVISIQPGLRFIYNTKFSAPLVYSLNVKYDVTERFTVRASFARGFRAPTLKELYLDFVDINHNIKGNKDLQAETSVNTNLFLQYNSSSERAYVWGLELNLFNNNIKDNIRLIRGNENEYSYYNVSRFVSRGVEFNFNNNIYPWLSIKFGFALTGKKPIFSDSDVGEFEYYSDFNTSLNYWWRKYDLNFSAYYKYNGKYPELKSSVDGGLAFQTNGAYNTLDINMSKWFFKRKMNIQIGGKNLFNNTNIDVSGDQGGGIHSGSGAPLNWGRTFFVKFQLRINK